MYLHKITIDSEALRRDRKIYQDVYLLHKKIWELVSRNENQKRVFYIGLNMMLIRISNIFIYLRRIRFHLKKA